MIEIRASRPEDVPELQELFQLCFGDGPEISGLYFDRLYHPEEFILLREDNELRAMAGLLSVNLTEPDGRTVKAAYLYAMGTHPEHQGKGFAAQLLHYADFYLRGKADCIVTMPATDDLHTFYAKFDFSECFPLLEGEITPRMPEDGETSVPVSAETYENLREELLTGHHHVTYNRLTSLQDGLCRYSGGTLLQLNVNGIPGCAAVEHWNDTAVCKELLIHPDALDGGIALAAQAVFASHFVLRRPAFWPMDGLSHRNFGMIKWFDPIAANRWQGADAPYMGLAFD